jgi:hypothetical protein
MKHATLRLLKARKGASRKQDYRAIVILNAAQRLVRLTNASLLDAISTAERLYEVTGPKDRWFNTAAHTVRADEYLQRSAWSAVPSGMLGEHDAQRRVTELLRGY